MSFSKTVMIEGKNTEFKLSDDGVVVSDGHSDFEIAFDMFMTTAEREEVASGLASPHFIEKQEFLKRSSTSLIYSNTPQVFTSDSYDFMIYLKKLGLPNEIAAQTAFLTDIPGFVSFDLRHSVFEAFRKNLHAIKLSQSGGFTGLITFVPYFLITEWGGLKLASRASRKVNDEPAPLLELMAGLLQFKGGKIADDVSDVQFDVLTDFMKDSFPTLTSPDRLAPISKFLMEFVQTDIDWRLAASYITADLAESTDKLDQDLLDFVNETVNGRRWNRYRSESVSSSLKTVIAILKSKFSETVLREAFGVIAANRELITARSEQHFMAYVAIADYLASGGSKDDSIGWMISMEPMIDQDRFFNRALIDTI